FALAFVFESIGQVANDVLAEQGAEALRVARLVDREHWRREQRFDPAQHGVDRLGIDAALLLEDRRIAPARREPHAIRLRLRPEGAPRNIARANAGAGTSVAITVAVSIA